MATVKLPERKYIPGTCVNFLTGTGGCCFLHLLCEEGWEDPCMGCCCSSCTAFVFSSPEEMWLPQHVGETELTAACCDQGSMEQAEHSCESGQCPFYRVKSYPCEINGIFAITGPGFLPEVPHCNLR